MENTLKNTGMVWIMFFVTLVILALTVRGLLGVPSLTELVSTTWTDNGPLELSRERGVFALLYSVVEEKAVHLSLPLARFAVPDVDHFAGRYVSLFAPGLSFLVIPGYVIGKFVGASQVGVYATIAVFAFLNCWLLYAIARRLQAAPLAAAIGAFTFLFATPAFPYAVSLYQHHVSVFLFLVGLYCLIRWAGNMLPLLIVWLSIAFAIVVDYANIILFLPLAIYALYQAIGFVPKGSRWFLRVNPGALLAPVVLVLPLFLLLLFNQVSYNDSWRFLEKVSGVSAMDELGNPVVTPEADVREGDLFSRSGQKATPRIHTFQSRNLLNGFIIHFMSRERGMVVFAPVLLFGLLGIGYCYKNYPHVASVIIGAIGVNILLYSLWSDPWGGWAFGSRYLILSYALMSLFVALALSMWRKYWIMLLIFFALFSYSVAINTMGALSTNTNPPQSEAFAIEKASGIARPYTYQHNRQFLSSNQSKSFVWQTFASPYLFAWQYYQVIMMVLVITCAVSIYSLFVYDRD